MLTLLPRLFAFALCALCAAPTEASDVAEPRRIALSFDDAPRGDTAMLSGRERTDRLIAGLQEVEVEGVLFFVTTHHLDSVEDGEQRLRDYVAAGHRLANHSHQHLWLSRTEVRDYLDDIDEARQRLSTLPGVLPLFRFPFLDEGRDAARRDTVRSALDDRGLTNGYVTVDTYDWYLDLLLQQAREAGRTVDMNRLRSLYVETLVEAVEFYDGIAQRHLGRSPAHVLLLHENDLAAMYVPDLVRTLQQRGWQIIPAEAAYQDPIAQVLPDTLFLGQGRVAALARLQGVPAPELVNRWEDESALSAQFESRVLSGSDIELRP
jgi:peptidoglycan/xylan/chitin deacetylase (PgdA/CDA1 family)